MKHEGGVSTLQPHHGYHDTTSKKRNNSEEGISGEGMSLHWLTILEDAAQAARSCQSLYDTKHEESFAFSRSSSARSSLARFFCVGKNKRSKSRKRGGEELKKKSPIRNQYGGSGNPAAAALLDQSKRRGRSLGTRSMDEDSWSRYKLIEHPIDSKKRLLLAQKFSSLSQNARSSLSGWGDSGVMDQSSDAGTSFGDEGLLTSSIVGSSKTRQDYNAFYQQQSIPIDKYNKEHPVATNNQSQHHTTPIDVEESISKIANKSRKQSDGNESGFDDVRRKRRRKAGLSESPTTSEEAKQGSATSSQTSLSAAKTDFGKSSKKNKTTSERSIEQIEQITKIKNNKTASPNKPENSILFSEKQKSLENTELFESPAKNPEKALLVKTKDLSEYYPNTIIDLPSQPIKKGRTTAYYSADESSVEGRSNLTADASSSASIFSTASEDYRPAVANRSEETRINYMNQLSYIDAFPATKTCDINTILEESYATTSESSSSASSSEDTTKTNSKDPKKRKENIKKGKTKKTKKIKISRKSQIIENRDELQQETSTKKVIDGSSFLGCSFLEEIDNLKKLESEKLGCLEYHGPGITVVLPSCEELQEPSKSEDDWMDSKSKIFPFAANKTFSSTLPTFLRDYKTEPTSRTLSKTFRWQTPAIYKSRKTAGSDVTFENVTYKHGKPPKGIVKRCLLTIVWSFAKTEVKEDITSLVRVARLQLDYDLSKMMNERLNPVVHERKEGATEIKWLEESTNMTSEKRKNNYNVPLEKNPSSFSDTGLIMETVRQVCDNFEKAHDEDIFNFPIENQTEITFASSRPKIINKESEAVGKLEIEEKKQLVDCTYGKDDELFDDKNAARYRSNLRKEIDWKEIKPEVNINPIEEKVSKEFDPKFNGISSEQLYDLDESMNLSFEKNKNKINSSAKYKSFVPNQPEILTKTNSSYDLPSHSDRTESSTNLVQIEANMENIREKTNSLDRTKISNNEEDKCSTEGIIISVLNRDINAVSDDEMQSEGKLFNIYSGDTNFSDDNVAGVYTFIGDTYATQVSTFTADETKDTVEYFTTSEFDQDELSESFEKNIYDKIDLVEDFYERSIDLNDQPFATSSPKDEEFFGEYHLLADNDTFALQRKPFYSSFSSDDNFQHQQPTSGNNRHVEKEMLEENLKNFSTRESPRNFLNDDNADNERQKEFAEIPRVSDTEDEKYFSPLDQSFLLLCGTDQVTTTRSCDVDSSSLEQEWFSCEQSDSDKKFYDDRCEKTLPEMTYIDVQTIILNKNSQLSEEKPTSLIGVQSCYDSQSLEEVKTFDVGWKLNQHASSDVDDKETIKDIVEASDSDTDTIVKDSSDSAAETDKDERLMIQKMKEDSASKEISYNREKQANQHNYDKIEQSISSNENQKFSCNVSKEEPRKMSELCDSAVNQFTRAEGQSENVAVDKVETCKDVTVDEVETCKDVTVDKVETCKDVTVDEVETCKDVTVDEVETCNDVIDVEADTCVNLIKDKVVTCNDVTVGEIDTYIDVSKDKVVTHQDNTEGEIDTCINVTKDMVDTHQDVTVNERDIHENVTWDEVDIRENVTGDEVDIHENVTGDEVDICEIQPEELTDISYKYVDQLTNLSTESSSILSKTGSSSNQDSLLKPEILPPKKETEYNERNVQFFFQQKSESTDLVKSETFEREIPGITTEDSLQTNNNQETVIENREENNSEELKVATNGDEQDLPTTDKYMKADHLIQSNMKSQIARYSVYTTDDSTDYDDDEVSDDDDDNDDDDDEDDDDYDDRVIKHSKLHNKDENKLFSINDVQIQRSSLVLKLLQDINADDDEEEEDEENENIKVDLPDSEKTEIELESGLELCGDTSAYLPLALRNSNKNHVIDLKLIDITSRDDLLFEEKNGEVEELFTLNENIEDETNQRIAKENEIELHDMDDESKDSINETSKKNELNLSTDNLSGSSSKFEKDWFESEISTSKKNPTLEDVSQVSENVFERNKSTADDAKNVIEALGISSRLIDLSSTETNFDESSISNDLEDEIMEVISSERQVEILSPSEESGEEYDIEKDIDNYFFEHKESLNETSNSIQNNPTSNLETPEFDKDGSLTNNNFDECDRKELITKTTESRQSDSECPITEELVSLQADNDVGSEKTIEITSNENKNNLENSKNESEKQMFGGLKKLFFDFFKVDKKEEKQTKEKSVSVGENNSGSSSESESSGGIKNCSASTQVIDKSIEEEKNRNFSDLNGEAKECYNTGDGEGHESLSETENSAPGEVAKVPTKTQSTFYEFHMRQKPREAETECFSQNIKIVKTKQDDSGSVLVQVFARNDAILQEIERQFPDQKQDFDLETRKNTIDGDVKSKECPTNRTGTSRPSRSSPLNNTSGKQGSSGNSFLSPSNRGSKSGQRSRSSSNSPNRRNPSADKRRMRNRLLSQAEISPSMDTMEENFGFLPNRVTVQITPSMNDQITATLNTVENFYRMIGEEIGRDRLHTAQPTGAQIVTGKTEIKKEDVTKTAAVSRKSSSFAENHSYMRDQLERIFKESAGSGMRYDGTPVDRIEREQEDRQNTFEGKWVPVYDYKDGDGNILKLPGMATAEWMTLTDGRGQYSTAGGGRIFARRRRSKNLQREESDDSGETNNSASGNCSAEETFLEQVGPEIDHLSLTNVRETGKRLIYFLDKTEEASAAATKLVSDVIGSPETEDSIDGLDEDEEIRTGLTDQIMLIFSSSDLAAGAFGGIGGETVPEVWEENSAAALPIRQSTAAQEADLSGVAIENNGNGNKTPELWTTVESDETEDRRREFSDRRWFSDEEHAIYSPPSREELKRRHRSIEDGISSFDTKLNKLTDRIRRLRKSSLESSHVTDSYNTAADHESAANFDYFSNTSVRPATLDSQSGYSSYYSAVSSTAALNDSSAVVGYGSSSDGSLPFDPIITAHEYAEMISVFKFCSVQFKKSFDTRRPVRWTDDRPPIMVLPPRWVWGGPFADTRSFPMACLHSSAIVHLSEQREYSPIAVAIVSDNFYVVATSNMLYSQPGTIAVSVSRRRKSRRKRKDGGTEEDPVDASFETEDGLNH